uniref:MD-2-related lipid-recognition domain-containing protein n=1 Tax=Stomoxys calcitrans TaxID=35570 RepID=A0A1I8PZV9_STOCA
MLEKLFFAVIFVISVHTVSGAKRPFNLELQSPRCNRSADVVKMCDCIIYRLGKNRYSSNAWFELNRQLHSNAEVAVTLYYNLAKSDRIVKFIDVKMKTCDIMSSLQRLPLMRDILTEMRRHSNFPLGCPFKGNVVYNLSNLIITKEIVPPYASTVNFNISIKFYEHQIQIGYYNLSGATVPRS